MTDAIQALLTKRTNYTAEEAEKLSVVCEELLKTVKSAKAHQEHCVKTNTDALRGTTWHILNIGLAAAEKAAAK